MKHKTNSNSKQSDISRLLNFIKMPNAVQSDIAVINTIKELLNNQEKRSEMGISSRSMGKLDAAENIVKLIDGLTL